MGKKTLHHRAEEFEKLLASGLNRREIAERYGCSRQNVDQMVARYNVNQFKGFTEEGCVYVGLRNWLNENKCSLSELLRRIHGRNVSTGTRTQYSERLKGKVKFTMPEINAILGVTGKTYEELFLEVTE